MDPLPFTWVNWVQVIMICTLALGMVVIQVTTWVKKKKG